MYVRIKRVELDIQWRFRKQFFPFDLLPQD
jgi:hypothetical protein